MSDERKSVEESMLDTDENVIDVERQEEELVPEDETNEDAVPNGDDDDSLLDDDDEVDELVEDDVSDASTEDEAALDDASVDEDATSSNAVPVPEAAPSDDSAPSSGAPSDGKEAGEPPRPEGTAWYVIHSYSGYENKVQKNLYHRIESMDMHNKIFQVVVPTEEEVELKDGQRRTIERRVFPGYILVEMVLDEDSWYVVRNTPGVTGFVGSGTKPTPLRQDEVDKIIKRMDAEVPKIKVSFKVGQKVRIVEGPFEDFMGTVDEIDLERARVRVLVNFFGRETPIELDFLQVERT
jgi:transcriptional antiterminator NusG